MTGTPRWWRSKEIVAMLEGLRYQSVKVEEKRESKRTSGNVE
jgi:hypothetical protein